MQPVTQYAKSGDVHIAYQAFGDGPINLVMVPGFVSNVENYWDEPDFARFLTRLASYARVVTFDKRGTGMSDRVAELPGLDQRMDDLRAVMDAAGMEQAAILGISEGAPLSILFAATYPDRCRALVLYGSFSRFSYWFPTEEALAAFFDYVEQAWGTGGSVQRFAPSRTNDAAFQRWWGRNERLGASHAHEQPDRDQWNSSSGSGAHARDPPDGGQDCQCGGWTRRGGAYPRRSPCRASGNRPPFLRGRERRRNLRCDRGIFDRFADTGAGRSRPGYGSIHRHRWLDREGCRTRRSALARSARPSSRDGPAQSRALSRP